MSAKEGTRLITKALFIKVLLNQEVVGRNKVPVDKYYRELIEGTGADGIADELEELGVTDLPNNVQELTEEQLGQIYEAFFLHEVRADGYDEDQIKEAREYCFDLKNEDTYVVGRTVIKQERETEEHQEAEEHQDELEIQEGAKGVEEYQTRNHEKESTEELSESVVLKALEDESCEIVERKSYVSVLYNEKKIMNVRFNSKRVVIDLLCDISGSNDIVDFRMYSKEEARKMHIGNVCMSGELKSIEQLCRIVTQIKQLF